MNAKRIYNVFKNAKLDEKGIIPRPLWHCYIIEDRAEIFESKCVSEIASWGLSVDITSDGRNFTYKVIGNEKGSSYLTEFSCLRDKGSRTPCLVNIDDVNHGLIHSYIPKVPINDADGVSLQLKNTRHADQYGVRIIATKENPVPSVTIHHIR